MLESRSLWISPAAGFQESGRRRGETVRTVHAEFAGRELGCFVAHPLRWWPWNIVATISAFEGPDRSAVFAGRRAGWLPGDWDVHEADGQLVGIVRGAHILHAAGEILGRIDREPSSAAGRVLSLSGSRLTVWKSLESGTQIELAPELDDQPFAKMAVLIAVLIGL